MVAELDSKPSGVTRVGSSPTSGTYLNEIIDKISTQNPSSDKKTLVANESILPMSIG